MALWLAGGASAVGLADPSSGTVAFDRYTSQSSYGELFRRLLSPLEAAQFMRRLEDSGGSAASQPLDLANERFLVRVPPREPEQGYGLLVFVPPWQEATLPRYWAPVLDRYGVVFVTAARSGNDESAMARREPLALLAAYNVMQRYPIDPRRVYIGGFSGGARVALRLGVGYPDLFRGALLNAGSDVIGDGAGSPPIPLPSRELTYRLQESSRFVYATGERDEGRVAEDRMSARSLDLWCSYDHVQFELPRVGHTIPDAYGLARALAALDAPSAVDTERLSHCRDSLDAELDGRLRKVATLLAGGHRAAADDLLRQIDRRYGGLAAPRSLELSRPNSSHP